MLECLYRWVLTIYTTIATSWSLVTRDFVGGSLPLHWCPSSLWTFQPIAACNRHYKSPKRLNFQNKPSPTTGGAATPARDSFLSPGGFSSDRRLQLTRIIPLSWLVPLQYCVPLQNWPKPAFDITIRISECVEVFFNSLTSVFLSSFVQRHPRQRSAGWGDPHNTKNTRLGGSASPCTLGICRLHSPNKRFMAQKCIMW